MASKKILLFGAGKSATVLIEYLIDEAYANDWQITIADANLDLILQKTGNRERSLAVEVDINNSEKRKQLINDSDIVISMMPPALHILIAKDCIEFRKSLLTASYADDSIKSLENLVDQNELLFLCEMGLDPGIDHMSAMELIDEIKEAGGEIVSFKSHCGGLVAPESDDNPWHYKISWNPRNVVLAGKAGAIYLDNGEVINESYEDLFNSNRTVTIENENNAIFSYYPNRNSLPYIDLYHLPKVKTFIRTTLRYEEFMQGWKNLIELHLTDETPTFNSDGKSLKDFYKEHLYKNGFNNWLDHKLSNQFSESNKLLEDLEKLISSQDSETFNLSSDEKKSEEENLKLNSVAQIAAKMDSANLILKQLFFLGLEDAETFINKGFCSPADVLQVSLENKLVLKESDKDMVVMLHEIEYLLNNKVHLIKSSLLVKGKDNLHTAMAKTVGLPLGIAAKLILNKTIETKGIQIPTQKEIYKPVLQELKKYGIEFKEVRS